MPTAAKSVPSATSVPSSARGSHSAIGLRATVASPAVNGNTKNASAMPPARSSHVHRNEVDASVTNAASGSASRNGGGGGRSPLRMRYASASAAAAITRYSGSKQECLLGAQLDGDTERGGREHGDRDDRGVARERDGERDRCCDADDDEPYPSRVVEEEPDVLVSDERPGETARRRAEQPEPDERKDPAARDERADRAQRAQERGDLRELRVLHDRRTLRHE